MTEKATTATPSNGTTDKAPVGAEVATRATGPLVSEQGRTSIADTVVSKIAGIATREISGVHDLGGGTARAVGALRERIPGSRTNLSQGVGRRGGRAAGRRRPRHRRRVRRLDRRPRRARSAATSSRSVERMTGLEVTEVNITVHDIFLDDGTDDARRDRPRRVTARPDRGGSRRAGRPGGRGRAVGPRRARAARRCRRRGRDLPARPPGRRGPAARRRVRGARQHRLRRLARARRPTWSAPPSHPSSGPRST